LDDSSNDSSNKPTRLGVRVYADKSDSKESGAGNSSRKNFTFKLQMNVTCILGGNPITEPRDLGSVSLPYEPKDTYWLGVLRGALNDGSKDSQGILSFLQNTIVYGVNARQAQNQFVLPLNFQVLGALTRAKFLSSDEDHWYCARGTGASKAG